MAVLEKIREKTVLVLVMIGLGMFGFLFMGSDQSSIFSCNGQQNNTIGTVNGEEIDKIFEGYKVSGKYNYKWDASYAPSGIYFVIIKKLGILIFLWKKFV